MFLTSIVIPFPIRLVARMLALLPRIQPLPGLESGYGDFLLSSLVPDIWLNPFFLTPEQIKDQQALCVAALSLPILLSSNPFFDHPIFERLGAGRWQVTYFTWHVSQSKCKYIDCCSGRISRNQWRDVDVVDVVSGLEKSWALHWCPAKFCGELMERGEISETSFTVCASSGTRINLKG